ncbi:hypothetical protein P171DRAFT_429579 [Karstenula rhodostoma CBS 690.94]|uniref:Uncharacterized protein n=1 Tax=Karstenula rhodostoma CBS 690.94 TaxID=1392251 RepID=A0A9P4PRM8_9PLEO|nr:hypothetical protein P171DRAFT_429579 [Karstenula rhodostoma CBS 690.94]
MKSLKSLFKHSDRHKDSLPEATSSHPEVRLGPAQLLEEHQKQERKSTSDLYREPYSHAQPKASSSHASPSSRQSVQHPASANGHHSVGATEHAAQPPSLSERGDDTIGDDYRVYMRAISPGSITSKGSTDADFVSLGSDSRLRIGNSEMGHNEDIADRNIEHHGSSSPRDNSLRSQKSAIQIAQDHTARRKSIAASVGSLRSVPSSIYAESAIGSASPIQTKSLLGTGVATGGSLVDSTLPHVEDPHARLGDRKNWPTRITRDESRPSKSLNGHERDNDDANGDRESFGRRNKTNRERDGSMGLREALMAGPGGYDLKAVLDGVVDLTNTEDTDQDVQWAPAVTQEVVKPHQHEVIEERIYREIHNHDVYRYTQPVYQTEILPARHFVYNTNNELVEVSADQLPDCTGAKQRWAVVRGDREKPTSYTVRSAPPRRELKTLSDKTYMTPEGYERRETTILHPPELEDLSNYGGPVVPIEFLHYPEHVPEHVPEHELKEEEEDDHLPNDQQFAMDGLANALPALGPESSSSSSRAATGSSASSRASKRLSIPRKPVPANPSY